MTRFRSIRVRLTAWYFLSLVLLLGLVAIGSWYGMQASVYQAIDDGLRHRIPGVEQALIQYSGLNRERLNEELAESSDLLVGGGLFRIFDEHQQLVYQSEGFDRHHVLARPPELTGSEVTIRNGDRGQWRLRLAAKRVDIKGRPWVVEIGEPLRSYEMALRRFARIEALSLPILALLATLAGFYISSRALAPVDRINRDVLQISASNLSARLTVEKTRDELQRLSETLNSMLDRIESSFNRNRQFTADASHELRAPLTLIHAAAEFSLRRERTNEELREALSQILRESTRTTALVDNLLTLARSDAGAKPFEPAPVSLTGLVEDLRLQTFTLADATQKEIDFHLPAETLQVLGDELALRRLCLILIDNAIKYTPSNGLINVSLAEENGAAVISVRDTGIGISREQLPHIFDRFWRADKVRSREIGGAGLGLSIARVIAEQHGGGIDAESEPGQGSCFVVTIPLFSGNLQLQA